MARLICWFSMAEKAAEANTPTDASDGDARRLKSLDNARETKAPKVAVISRYHWLYSIKALRKARKCCLQQVALNIAPAARLPANEKSAAGAIPWR